MPEQRGCLADPGGCCNPGGCSEIKARAAAPAGNCHRSRAQEHPTNLLPWNGGAENIISHPGQARADSQAAAKHKSGGFCDGRRLAASSEALPSPAMSCRCQ